MWSLITKTCRSVVSYGSACPIIPQTETNSVIEVRIEASWSNASAQAATGVEQWHVCWNVFLVAVPNLMIRESDPPSRFCVDEAYGGGLIIYTFATRPLHYTTAGLTVIQIGGYLATSMKTPTPCADAVNEIDQAVCRQRRFKPALYSESTSQPVALH